MARPSKYSKEIADHICTEIASGRSLRAVCEDNGIPTKTTVLNWLLNDDYKEFLDQYARAREIQSESLIDEIIDIADDGRNDYVEQLGDDQAGVYRINGENIQRSKLRIDTRKWYAAKLRPKVYGEKQKIVTDDGKGNDAPISQPSVDLSKLSLETLKELESAYTERDKS